MTVKFQQLKIDWCCQRSDGRSEQFELAKAVKVFSLYQWSKTTNDFEQLYT